MHGSLGFGSVVELWLKIKKNRFLRKGTVAVHKVSMLTVASKIG